MINFRIIARAFSLLLFIEGLFMLLSACIAFLYHEQDVSAFCYSALITIVSSVLVYTPLKNEEKLFSNKEGYIIVTGIWIIFSLFSTLPYIVSGSIRSFGDAFFESMSGCTTTGATILTNIEAAPHGILFWRSLTQWLGGIGMIFISLSVFPILKSLNIQIAAVEFSPQPAYKIYPRTPDAVKRLVTVYALLTVAEIILLVIGGMPVFDAVCHSFSTLSTGGFSTRNNGIAAFSSPYIMIVLTAFMFIAGTNMTLIYFGVKGNFGKISRNQEFFSYALVCILFSLLVALFLVFNSGFGFGKALLDGFFHVISVITTTGFYTQGQNLWGNAIITVLLLLMFIGGTAGSTSGGVKIVRLLLIVKSNRQEMKKLIHPYAFIPVRLDKRIIPLNTIHNLLTFIALYFLIMSIGTLVISFMGYDIITSLSTSASMLGNIGPALGTFGPFTNYSALPMAGKWFLTGMMLLGRLELITVMILFSKGFYKQ